MPVDIPLHIFETGEAIINGQSFEIKETPLRRGGFSPFYVNLRNLRSFPFQRDVVVDAMQLALDEAELDFVADVPTAMTPLVALLANRLLLPQLTPRLDNKGYGNKATIDGVYQENMRGVLFEDTVTSGGSLLNGAMVMSQRGLHIRPIIVIDREQGGMDLIRSFYPNATAVMTVSQLLTIGHRMGRFSNEDLDNCFTYLGK